MHLLGVNVTCVSLPVLANNKVNVARKHHTGIKWAYTEPNQVIRTEYVPWVVVGTGALDVCMQIRLPPNNDSAQQLITITFQRGLKL